MRSVPAALAVLLLPASAGADCGLPEPRRSFSNGTVWLCEAIDWPAGDTLTLRCDNNGIHRVRVRGTGERVRGHQGTEALRRRTQGIDLTVLPRHRARDLVVADVLDGAINIGEALSGGGVLRAACATR
ncbi:hypothetical protein GXW71_26550 [Roseomonas hellenica]|uniref:Uncharacterized protein n=1 Tax=Plastoroseomonas hellenica TaxID=2687306 RepID=A0ABS5F5X7_9PROT|nr:hypothetical protein [Plastoroseomonas hellenica]MBR0667944.1 hypothetical protein [Plastoroseomonas hellenica]